MTSLTKKTEQTYPVDRLSSKFSQSVADYTTLSNNVLSSTRSAASNQSLFPTEKNTLTDQINSLFGNSSSKAGCYKNNKLIKNSHIIIIYIITIDINNVINFILFLNKLRISVY